MKAEFNERWLIYRKTDQHLPELILNENHQTICALPNLDKVAVGKLAVEDLELNARVISSAPTMIDLLQQIDECLSEEREIDHYKQKIRLLLAEIFE